MERRAKVEGGGLCLRGMHREMHRKMLAEVGSICEVGYAEDS